MKSKYILRGDAAVYAVGHFLIDFSCALIMLSLQAEAWHFVLYNFLAFAVQMPIGLMADFVGRNRGFALTGVILVLLGFLPCAALVRVILIGLGNACYHVGGGRDAILRKDGLTGLGIFVSPGAVGIFLGTVLSGNPVAATSAALSLMVCGVLIYKMCSQTCQVVPKGKLRINLAGIMLTVVLLRSLVGMCMETPWKTGAYVVLGALAAGFGKALGGFLGDRFGWKQTGACSLILAAMLFLLPYNGSSGVLGVLLFNMTMPITLGRAADGCPGYEGFAFGLLTFGLFLGYLPSAFGLSLSPVIGTGLALTSAGLLVLSPEDRYG